MLQQWLPSHAPPHKITPVLYIEAIRPGMWSSYHNEFLQPSHQTIIIHSAYPASEWSKWGNEEMSPVSEEILRLLPKTIERFTYISTHPICSPAEQRLGELRCCRSRKTPALPQLCICPLNIGVFFLCNSMAFHGDTPPPHRHTDTHRKEGIIRRPHTDGTYSSCRETSPSNNPLGSSVILLP